MTTWIARREGVQNRITGGDGNGSDLLPGSTMQNLGSNKVLINQRSQLNTNSSFEQSYQRNQGYTSMDTLPSYVQSVRPIAISPTKNPIDIYTEYKIRPKIYKIGTTTGNTAQQPLQPESPTQRSPYTLGATTQRQVSPKARQVKDTSLLYTQPSPMRVSFASDPSLMNLNQREESVPSATATFNTKNLLQRKDIWPSLPTHSVTEDGLHKSYTQFRGHDRDFKGQLNQETLTGGYSDERYVSTKKKCFSQKFFWKKLC